MFEAKNFDNWIEDNESGKFGSGASEKVWLLELLMQLMKINSYLLYLVVDFLKK